MEMHIRLTVGIRSGKRCRSHDQQAEKDGRPHCKRVCTVVVSGSGSGRYNESVETTKSASGKYGDLYQDLGVRNESGREGGKDKKDEEGIRAKREKRGKRV
jgi:hypothetical protein